MKRFFYKELDEYRSTLVLMMEKTIEVCRDTFSAILNEDSEAVEAIMKRDDEFDRLEIEIDNAAIRYMTLRSPVASDLRLLTCGMRMSHELERAADQCNNICKRYLRFGTRKGSIKNFYEISKMSDHVCLALKHVTESLQEMNVSLAEKVVKDDQKINEMHNKTAEAMIQYITENSEYTVIGVELLFISKAIERIGDYAANVAEDIIFLASGLDVRHQKGSHSLD